MSVTLEQIDLLRERAKVSYQDAKEALEFCNGNMVDALIYLEKQNKVKIPKNTCCDGKIIDKAKFLIKKGNQTKFIIKKEDHDVLNIPVNAAIVIGVVATPIAVAGVAIALVTKHRIKIKSPNGEDSPVNTVLDKVSNTVNSMTDMLTKDASKPDLNKKENI